MIYPDNFETKIGFHEIRNIIKEHCLSTLGKELVDYLSFLTDARAINAKMAEIREFRRIIEKQEDFPSDNFHDVREALKRVRIVNTHLEESELFDLRRSLDTLHRIKKFLVPSATDEQPEYPTLALLAEEVTTYPTIIQRIDQILDKFGHIRDTASPALRDIRRELARMEGSISRTLYSILHAAQSEGLVDKDVTPTLRDGRLVIPVAPGLKRKIQGIVHDESATGRTVYIEPTEVVEANNKIRELESDERQEIIKILTDITNKIRPEAPEMLRSYVLMAQIDFIQAKAHVAIGMQAFEPNVEETPHIDWIRARHPILAKTKEVVPLDITLTADKRILIISGPNAGGKSVCLKTVGLLQYMLQMGIGIPLGERSTTGVFQNIMIDIGDEQSLENDLSTYSGHLLNMKNMMKHANDKTLILIDEFGTGTEPQIGGAIAESVLGQFCKKQAFGVITTHYQNLKHFADSHEGVANGAMLYDRHEMRPLFQLAIGRPGSSFAIEIARKIGLPEEVIQDASEIVGNDYIQSDKYLQDIVRDKRYWENKRQSIHQREKDMEKTISRYEAEIEALEKSRKEIMQKARQQAEELLKESNKRIENTIREIKEHQAEKEETRKIRQELKAFEENILIEKTQEENDEAIARKIEQIKQRRERSANRKKNKANQEAQAAEAIRKGATLRQEKHEEDSPLQIGDTVRIKGLKSVGKIENIEGKMASVIFGDMRTKMKVDRLELAANQKTEESPAERLAGQMAYQVSRATRDTIDVHKNNFHQDLDVRGMRGDEALSAVQYFIDDAILVGMQQVRILHGKGNGILRQLIRQYLSTVPNVTNFRDEHVQFGGAGITVVEL
ncbi:Smr/MutS family protein [Prevotella sp. A2931]|uniref:Endonuclease MutS2 n=1 Tax=Prevotella illustrans TaxID=2800387 RepID=A0ABS3M3Y6_9BACT|nr:MULTISPECIES: Smr/MutS family protein [Prevotella]MBO1362888.1 Smr/MutS family protein [Prevotella illustrans]PTL25950.1 endonuclease MutS2 [Prevotella sp. oral taxon 820]